jgi:hypothetical protein
MASCIPDSPRCGSGGFRKVVDAFLSSEGLPFADVLSEERIERIFAKHNNWFGGRGIYDTAIMVWSFLGQVLRDDKEASCQSAVARVVSYCKLKGLPSPTRDTGDYCRARAKLSEAALHELSCEVASGLEEAAEASWLWKNRHAKLIDGFTFTMPDTPKNQARYPQPNTQKPGVGFPMARAVAILSLAMASVMDLAIGPCQGKQTGESALLRSLLQSLKAGDIAVLDRFFCSFMMIALLRLQGVDTCTRKHQRRRHSDFRRGRRLGKCDHIIIWTRPPKPDWMDDATYAQIPETLELREICYQIVKRGRRTKTITIITTLTDDQEYTNEDIAQLYEFRWNSEIDIRSIKESLNLDHVRCKSPEMVHRELWATILAYNLIRATAAGAALVHGKQPRQISFTGTCQYVLASWMTLTIGMVSPQCCLEMLKQIADCEVANRPGRLEPRVVKRRPKPYPLMQKPRPQLRRELRKKCT